jgi:hypothetical protein
MLFQMVSLTLHKYFCKYTAIAVKKDWLCIITFPKSFDFIVNEAG